MGGRSTWAEVSQDLQVNRGRPQSQVVLLAFRFAQHATHRWRPSPLRTAVLKLQVLLSYWCFHVELHPDSEACPTLGDGVVVGAGAIMITVVGNPARVAAGRGSEDQAAR